MSPLYSILVGYKFNDRRRWLIEDQARYVSKCIGCSAEVWFSKSGQAAYMERDPQVVCTDCQRDYKDEIQGQL